MIGAEDMLIMVLVSNSIIFKYIFLIFIHSDRRPPYDDRSAYADGARGGYDDRRMAPGGGFDDRRGMNDRRPLMDQQMGPSRGPGANSFDRSGGSSDMFSRRDSVGKPM